MGKNKKVLVPRISKRDQLERMKPAGCPGAGALSQVPMAMSGWGVGMGLQKVLQPVASWLAHYQKAAKLSGETEIVGVLFKPLVIGSPSRVLLSLISATLTRVP